MTVYLQDWISDRLYPVPISGRELYNVLDAEGIKMEASYEHQNGGDVIAINPEDIEEAQIAIRNYTENRRAKQDPWG